MHRPFCTKESPLMLLQWDTGICRIYYVIGEGVSTNCNGLSLSEQSMHVSSRTYATKWSRFAERVSKCIKMPHGTGQQRLTRTHAEGAFGSASLDAGAGHRCSESMQALLELGPISQPDSPSLSLCVPVSASGVSRCLQDPGSGWTQALRA